MFGFTHLYFYPALCYLVHNFCKLREFTQLYEIQPGHIEDPAKRFGRAGFQIQSCAPCGKASISGIRSDCASVLEIYFLSNKNEITILQKTWKNWKIITLQKMWLSFCGTFPSSLSVLFTDLYHVIRYRLQLR